MRYITQTYLRSLRSSVSTVCSEARKSMFRVVREVVSMFAKSEFSDTFPLWDLSELGEQGTVFSVGGGVGMEV